MTKEEKKLHLYKNDKKVVPKFILHTKTEIKP